MEGDGMKRVWETQRATPEEMAVWRKAVRLAHSENCEVHGCHTPATVRWTTAPQRFGSRVPMVYRFCGAHAQDAIGQVVKLSGAELTYAEV